MPRTGLSEVSLAVLSSAVQDGDVVGRFRARLRQVPGSSCLWWTGAVSARGRGRFWVGDVAGQDVVVVAHRFAWALQFGVADLAAVPLLGHRCDNPLCQRPAVGHVQRSSHAENAREWAARRLTVGNPLRDSRGSRGRARAVRDVVRRDPSAAGLAEVLGVGLRADAAQLPLWPDLPGPSR